MKTQHKPKSSLTAALLDVLKDGPSTYEIRMGTQVDHRAIGRFLRGERSLTVTTVDRLLPFLGLEVLLLPRGEKAAPPARRRRKGA